MAGAGEKKGASRYETLIATLVGLSALCVSGYAAYMQRQQVRAAVWPILTFDSSNAPIKFTLSNKGVGPAIVEQVVVKVDNQPMKNWSEAVEKILGPGSHPYGESDMTGQAFSAGEKVDVFTPHNDANEPIEVNKTNPLWVKLDAARTRVTVEICYCSTLGECWILRGGGATPNTTTPTRHRPPRSAIAFQQ